MYPKNAWYVACSSEEIDDKPLGRTICDEAIVLYRGPNGVAAGLEDFCPHRASIAKARRRSSVKTSRCSRRSSATS